MEKTTFNISEVSRLTGKARSTITNHLGKGKLSCILDKDGNKLIEASEIIRAYPDDLELDSSGKLKSKTQRIENKPTSGADLQQIEKLLEIEKQERERERRQLAETMEYLRSDLEKSQERESRATLLLEHQSKDSDGWKKQMSEIEKRIANQEREVEKYKRALNKERSKTFWQRLFD